MNVALTGATGFIGSHVLTALLEHGHDVTALVREDADTQAITDRGAKALVTDIYDRGAVVDVLSRAEGAIHTASPGDETSGDFEGAIVDAAVEAFTGTSKPWIEISGDWVYGNNSSITEDSAFNPPPLVAWKEPIERRLLDANFRAVVIVSGVAYGDGGGAVPGVLLGSPRDDAGNLIMLGSGRQHWPTTHVADLADLFLLALENDSARGYYLTGNGQNSSVAELTEAAAIAAGASGAVAGSVEEAESRLGPSFAEVLLLDQQITSDKARTELGWAPSGPRLVDEFTKGSYRSS